MEIKNVIKSKRFLIPASVINIFALVFGNFDSSESINAPTSTENLFNFIFITLTFVIGLGIHSRLFSKQGVLRRFATWPRYLRLASSILVTLIVFAVISIPATAIRQTFDSQFKARHLQVQTDKAAADKAADKAIVDKAAADKAIVDKAAADKAIVDKAAADKAIVDKAAADKAAADKSSSVTNPSSEKLAGFTPGAIKNFKAIVSNIKAYLAALDSGDTLRASQICNLLDENYNGSLRGLRTTSLLPDIDKVLGYAKDEMYAGVSDCTRGFRKNRIDLITQSITDFVAASKYLDGLVLISQVK